MEPQQLTASWRQLKEVRWPKLSLPLYFPRNHHHRNWGLFDYKTWVLFLFNTSNDQMSILHMKDTFKKWQHLVSRVYPQEGSGTPKRWVTAAFTGVCYCTFVILCFHILHGTCFTSSDVWTQPPTAALKTLVPGSNTTCFIVNKINTAADVEFLSGTLVIFTLQMI